MHNLSVRWFEGLFLRPHHFQAADRYWAESQQTSEHWDHEYNYGVRTLELSEEAIANGQVQVNVCHARMRDGTLISIDPGQELDRVDLKEAFETESQVQVFLAVPRLRMGSANVATQPATAKTRYRDDVRSLADENAGGNNQEIQFRVINVKLLLSTQDTEGYELLPIAKIQRAGAQEAAPELDNRYFPPMLAVDAWAPLGRGVVRAVYDVIGKRIEILKTQVVERGISLATQVPGDLDRLLMLSQLNEAYARLRVQTFAAGVHPLTAYTELCGIVGRLSIFSPDRRVPDGKDELPYYDHDDLATIFHRVQELIELLLYPFPDYEYEHRYFKGEGLGMAVSLDRRWFNADWEWFVGVIRGSLSREKCDDLLGKLNWKLGSAERVEALFRDRLPGIQLTPLQQAPHALPPRDDVSYYRVTRGNAAWNDVLQTETLAMRLEQSLIANRHDLQDKQKLVVSHEKMEHPLEFVLYAVPKVT